jgi:hypothetical protein
MVQKPCSEATHPIQVLRWLPALAPITFMFTTTRARGAVRRTGVDVAHSNHLSSLASVIFLPRSSIILVIALVHVLVVTP